ARDRRRRPRLRPRPRPARTSRPARDGRARGARRGRPLDRQRPGGRHARARFASVRGRRRRPVTSRPMEAGAGTLRVLIVDDHRVVREGLRSYLSLFDEISIVGEASEGGEAVETVRELAMAGNPPDVVLLDLLMQPMDGISATA